MSVRNAILAESIMITLTLCACGGGSSGNDGVDDTEIINSENCYTVSGRVIGLMGSGLVLQNNIDDDLAITGDGNFTFSTELVDGSGYAVTVATQPSSPDGYCNVINGSGSLSGAAITDVEVRCISGRYNVVDTRQTQCYDSATGAVDVCTGRGYDADYSDNPPDYTLSDDGALVFDNVTGLIWTQTPDIDANGGVDVADKLTQPDAERYCSGLVKGDYNWRLPSIKELYSLIDFSGSDPSSYTGTDTSLLTPFLDSSVFEPGFGDTTAGERIIDGQYATGTLYVSPKGTIYGAGTMFGVNFIDGRIKGYPYDFPASNPKTFYVLCVAGNDEYGVNDFSDNGDGTISDGATGLMWESDDYTSADFVDAVAHCEASTTGGWSDWRLPDTKELQSIVDYNRAPDDSNSAALDSLFNATAFTNEAGETDWGFYWTSTTHTTYTGSGESAAYVAFGRALGYFDNAVTDVHGAGAQRSNHKTDISRQATGVMDVGFGSFYYHGPQGDILRLDNGVRCVRTL
jgi:hypothetical protein